MTAAALTTMSPAYQAARRRPNALRAEDISNTAHGVQQLLFEGPIDLVPQAADQDVDDIRLWIEVVLPDVRQDHRLRDDAPGVAHQVFEQRKLARPEFHGPTRPADAPR